MLDAEIDAKYERMGTDWRCLDCAFASRNRHHVIEHIEAKAGGDIRRFFWTTRPCLRVSRYFFLEIR
jgi:hypothetical protein